MQIFQTSRRQPRALHWTASVRRVPMVDTSNSKAFRAFAFLLASIFFATLPGIYIRGDDQQLLPADAIRERLQSWLHETEIDRVLQLRSVSIIDGHIDAAFDKANPNWSGQDFFRTFVAFESSHLHDDHIHGAIERAVARIGGTSTRRARIAINGLEGGMVHVAATFGAKVLFSMPLKADVPQNSLPSSGQINGWFKKRLAGAGVEVRVLEEELSQEGGACYYEAEVLGCRNVVIRQSQLWERLQIISHLSLSEQKDAKTDALVKFLNVRLIIDGQYAGGLAERPRLSDYRDMEPKYAADLNAFTRALLADFTKDIREGRFPEAVETLGKRAK